MQEAAIPPEEPARLAELRSYGVLDSEDERSFDGISHLVRDVAGTPIAVISLVDENRQWFKSCLGLDARETPRNVSFCGHTILQPTPLIIEDARADPRFCDNPLVTEAPGIRFYAGFPLISANGLALGSLCAIDLAPNRLNEAQIRSLQRLADQVVRLLELRRQTHLLQASQQALQDERRTGQSPEPAAPGSALGQLLGRDQLLHTIALLLRLPGPSCFALLRVFLKERGRLCGTLGSAVGEQLLEHTAARLVALLPAEASMARLGENELLVLLPHQADPTAVSALAGQLTAALDEPVRLDGVLLGNGVAIGIALHQGNYPDLDTLLADAALAEARARQARGSAFHIIDLATRLQARRDTLLEADLRQALRSGELVPFLQPLVALGSGELMGFECLARWRNRNGALCLPVDFLPAAGRAGLNGDLDLQMVEQVLALAADLAAAGPPRPLLLSVNLCSELLGSGAQRRRLRELIDANPLPPGWQLQLEIVEEALLLNNDTLEPFLRELGEQGVSIAIDDFGTGYSSLGRLHSLPFSAIKIDGSFVRRIDDPEQPSNGLLSAMQRLGRDLNLHITAEGVEREAQRQWLQQSGFDWGQGYLFGRPRSLADTLAELSGQGARPAAQDA